MYTYMIILHARITQYFIVFALSPIPCKQAATESTFNPLTFLLMTVKKDVEDWTSETLDRILRKGDWLGINTNLDYTPREDNTIFYCLCTFPNSLQASSHRGGDRYRTVGRQCTFNPLTFLLMTVKKDVEDWTSETLDRILRNGDHQHQPWRKSVSTCHRH